MKQNKGYNNWKRYVLFAITMDTRPFSTLEYPLDQVQLGQILLPLPFLLCRMAVLAQKP